MESFKAFHAYKSREPTSNFYFLTPKGPNTVFWQHSDFGQLTTNGIFNFIFWKFHTTCARGVALRPNKFYNFWLHGLKVIAWYVIFSIRWAAQKMSLKITLKNFKNWNWFFRKRERVWNRSILINQMKVMRSFSLWIGIASLDLQGLIQFSIF